MSGDGMGAQVGYGAPTRGERHSCSHLSNRASERFGVVDGTRLAHDGDLRCSDAPSTATTTPPRDRIAPDGIAADAYEIVAYEIVADDISCQVQSGLAAGMS